MKPLPTVRSTRLRIFLAFGLVGFGAWSYAPAAVAGGAASLSFAPSSWTAGPTQAGTSVSQTFNLTNTGSKSSGAISVTITGSAAFTATADTCTAVALGPNKSCTVTVQYTPASNTEVDAATVSATSLHASTSESLNGTGIFAKSASDCAAAGGTFSTDPSTGGLIPPDWFVWSCNNGPEFGFHFGAVQDDCLADAQRLGAHSFGDSVNESAPFNFVCFADPTS